MFPSSKIILHNYCTNVFIYSNRHTWPYKNKWKNNKKINIDKFQQCTSVHYMIE